MIKTLLSLLDFLQNCCNVLKHSSNNWTVCVSIWNIDDRYFLLSSKHIEKMHKSQSNESMKHLLDMITHVKEHKQQRNVVNVIFAELHVLSVNLKLEISNIRQVHMFPVTSNESKNIYRNIMCTRDDKVIFPVLILLIFL